MLEITGLERYNGEELILKLTSIESEMRECNKVNLNNEFILDLRERLNNPCRENWDYIEEALMPPKLQEYLNGLEDEVFINGLFECLLIVCLLIPWSYFINNNITVNFNYYFNINLS